MNPIDEFLADPEGIASGIMNHKERMDIYASLKSLAQTGNGSWTALKENEKIAGSEYVLRFLRSCEMTDQEKKARAEESRKAAVEQEHDALVQFELNHMRARAEAQAILLDVDHQPRTLLTPEEIAVLPDKQWVVENQIPLSPLLVYYYGLPEQGKSLVSLRLAHGISAGSEKVFGFEVARQLPVLYIDTEGRWDLKERMAAIEEHTGVKFSARSFRAISEEAVVFASKKNIERLIQEVSSAFPVGSPLVIIVDTQAGVTEGVAENSAEMMSPVIANFLMMARAFGGPIIVVHHSGKDGGDLRGSSAMRGRARAIYDVNGGKVKCEKFNGHDKHKCHFEFKILEVGNSVVATDPDPVSAAELDARKKMLATAKNVWEWILTNRNNGQDFTSTEVATQVAASVPGISKAQATACIRGFIEDGLVWQEDGTRQTTNTPPRTVHVKFLRPHKGLGRSYELWAEGGAEALRGLGF